MGTMKFPAKFSDTVLTEMRKVLDERQPDCSTWRILDPFAGTGRIHEVNQGKTIKADGTWRLTVGVDCEQPCVDAHIGNILGDATALVFPDAMFDCVATSPTYGNRMADTFLPKGTSRRHTYIGAFREATGDNGYKLAENSTCGLQWGDEYRRIHTLAIKEIWRVLKPGGLFLLNMSDHIREFVRQNVCEWWVQTCTRTFNLVSSEHPAFELLESRPVLTPRMRQGENHESRVPVEMLFVMRKAA